MATDEVTAEADGVAVDEAAGVAAVVAAVVAAAVRMCLDSATMPAVLQWEMSSW